jgi:hypothetical protein
MNVAILEKSVNTQNVSIAISLPFDCPVEVVPEAPAKAPLSIYAEETEIKDHAEEVLALRH